MDSMTMSREEWILTGLSGISLVLSILVGTWFGFIAGLVVMLIAVVFLGIAIFKEWFANNGLDESLP
jgi:hypothetical protein